jgi:hypothetical protein
MNDEERMAWNNYGYGCWDTPYSQMSCGRGFWHAYNGFSAKSENGQAVRA